MSLPGCGPDLLMTWVPMRALAVKIDALAATLNTPGYTNLVDIPDAPFQYTNKILEPEGFHQTFFLNGRSVFTRVMTTDKQGDAPYALPETNLDKLAALDELYYVADEDDCLCKTIYKVKPSGTEFTLATSGGSKCCQGLPVPNVGQDITLTDQHLLPKGLITQYLRSNYTQCCACCIPEGLSDMDACSNGGEAYAFTEVDPANTECKKITRLSRKISSGYFTWPFKKRYMELLVDKINYILQCARNDGTKPETLYRAGLIYQEDGGDFWFQQGSTCPTWQVDQWLASMSYTSALLDTEEGTLVYGDEEVISRLDRDKANPEGSPVILEQRGDNTKSGQKEKYPRPWFQKTPPTAEDCEEGPKVYAYALNSISDLVDLLAESVWPYGTFADPQEPTDCDTSDDELIYCCSTNGVISQTARKDCYRAYGTENSDPVTCISEAEILCASRTRRVEGVEEPCEWNGVNCECEDIASIIVSGLYYCCDDENEECYGPFDTVPPTCEVGYPVTQCGFTPTTETYCGNEDCTTEVGLSPACCDPITGQVIEGMNQPCDPTAVPCLACVEPNQICTREGELVFSCEGDPYVIEYVPAVIPITAPLYPALPDCPEKHPCCLQHPAFIESEKNCLSYLNEITAFVRAATDNALDECVYPDPSLIDPEDPNGGAVGCSEIRCGLICDEEYYKITDTEGHPIKVCLDQAPIMYSWTRREIEPGAIWPLSAYYDLVITAPTSL